MHLDPIVEWYRRDRTSQMSPAKIQELYFQNHPRTAFLKMLPSGARVVDVGAGDGSLSVFKEWPAPQRPDLRLHAYSIEKGPMFDEFESYEISDWDVQPPEFAGMSFDGVLSAHFIEHIKEPETLAAWAAKRLAPRGRVYVEWPSPNSLALPSRFELLEHGVDLVISRFDDDKTHQALPDRKRFEEALVSAGLLVEQAGVIRLPWIEDELMAHFREDKDPFMRQAAFWSWTGWSQYVVASAP